MILKSIKWRLQLWYGLILVAVLVGFGVTAYQLERNRIFRRVDDELHHRVNALAQQLHRPPHGALRGDPVDDDRPPPDQFMGDLPPGRGGPHPKFELTPQLAALFDTNTANDFYFVIHGPDDKEIARGGNVPAGERREPEPDRPPDQAAPAENAPRQPGPPQPMNLRGLRTLAQTLPSREQIEVGCSIAPELHQLQMTALTLAGFGGFILLLGFGGGWWFVGRALRPISEISSTATKISAGDLSQRINTAEAESELGQLAAVLNSTFARLETAFAQQKQFASDAAHELRTPVSVILTQTQTALNRERDAASYKQTVEACQRAAQRMRRLIESLLELARFDAGQEVLKRMSFDLAQTAAECMQLVQPLADERKVQIIPELCPMLFAGDPERLAQVVTNLLTNAIQYNRPDGEVRVKLSATGGLAVLEIANTGKGIAPEDLPHVFERFYRVDKSRTGAGNSGLGLSICKAIIEAHGGTIEIFSTEKTGTSVVVRLPAGGTH
jgi:heavy metal sensor kinase